MSSADRARAAMDAKDIIEYWFSDRVREKWWEKNAEFDQECRDQFRDIHRMAVNGELAHWRRTAEGRLAEVIVLDQLSRNMFRDTPAAFAQDENARRLTLEAVECGADRALSPEQRAFLYMPLMHSESLEDHEEAVRLYGSDPALEYNLGFEMRHKAIIERFGRYPHRNRILGRDSTPEEREFLQQPGSSF